MRAITLRPLVFRRPGIFALLLFQALWLNVILPGHTRGVITVPGFESAPASSAAAAAHGCCSTRSAPADDPQPGDGRAGSCAICYFAARLTLPPVIDLVPAPLALLEIREIPHINSLLSPGLDPTYLGRAPPNA